MLLLATSEPGFSLGDVYALGLLFAGLVLIVAIAALSHQHERAFSASVIYLVLGVAGAVAIHALDLEWVDPLDRSKLVERLSEFAVVVALFSTGLRLDRTLRPRSWLSVVRLLGLVMPLTIGAVALFGTAVIGLSLGAAIVLGAILAPTDPVLAGDVGVGPPGDENEESEPRFALTAEAGLNDGLAFPFLLLGLFIAKEGGTGWLLEWATTDVLYAIALGVAVGAAGGWLIAAGALRLHDRDLLLHALDGWMGIAAVLVIYGLAELAGGYGFLAAFAGGLAFRRFERDHEYNRSVHDGTEHVEKFSELALILFLGSMLTLTGLEEPGLAGWALVPVLLLLIRPAAVAIAMVRSPTSRRDRLFIGWFGVRGVGSLYYAAVAVGTGVLAPGEGAVVFWTAAACVVVSVFVHGVTASPVSRRLLDDAHEQKGALGAGPG